MSPGDDIPTWLQERMGLTVDRLLATGAASYLRGTPAEMAETLQRRREVTGVSYVCPGVDNADRLAPVVELLKGAEHEHTTPPRTEVCRVRTCARGIPCCCWLW